MQRKGGHSRQGAKESGTSINHPAQGYLTTRADGCKGRIASGKQGDLITGENLCRCAAGPTAEPHFGSRLRTQQHMHTRSGGKHIDIFRWMEGSQHSRALRSSIRTPDYIRSLCDAEIGSSAGMAAFSDPPVGNRGESSDCALILKLQHLDV